MGIRVALGVCLLALCALVKSGAHGQVAAASRLAVGWDKAGAQPSPLATRVPWKARHRIGVRTAPVNRVSGPALGALTPRRLRALGVRGGPRTKIDIGRWPAEPGAPAAVVPWRFERALLRLCPRSVPEVEVQLLAQATLAASHHFAVDPFLLAALSRQQSGCRANTRDSWGVGAARINMGMHKARIRDGAYHYGAPIDGGFQHVQLPLGMLLFRPETLLSPTANLHFAAAFLRVFSRQCPAIDEPFGSVPHRHPVSHMVWGDKVRSALAEALILTERRRMLAYYEGAVATTSVRYRDLELSCPLDGAPRLATGLLGDLRDHGRRIHNGVDLPAVLDEPVRAAADGVVRFAGVDTRRRGQLSLTPDQAARVPKGRMGPRGVYVEIGHAGGLRTLYVHLADYRVVQGQRIHRGEVIGRVGLTGVHTSDAHLHFGLFDGDVVLDPLRYFEPFLRANPVPDVNLHKLHKRLAKASRAM